MAAIVVVGFVGLVARTTRQEAVPVGASGGMAGMSMSGRGGAMRMSMRDIEGRRVTIPDGRTGVVVFVEPGDCRTCVDAVRAAARATRQSTGELTVVSIDSATSRDDVARLAEAAGRPRARYVVDDRSGSLTTMFGASGIGDTVIYDVRGRPVAHADSARQIARALRRAGR